MSYVDLIEWGLTKCLDLPFNLTVDLRLIFSIQFRVGVFMIWYHAISPNSFQAFDYLFALILWLIFDWQIYAELPYIKGEGDQWIYVREGLYKWIDILQGFATLIYLGVSLNGGTELGWVIAMLILTTFDFLLNLGEFFVFRKADHHQDLGYGGSVIHAFFVGLLIGVVYAFYVLNAGSNADEGERSWVFDPLIVFFAQLGEGFFVFYIITNWFDRRQTVNSNSLVKNCLGLTYGFVFAAFSLYYAIFLGIIIFIYILGWLYQKYEECCGGNGRVYPQR